MVDGAKQILRHSELHGRAHKIALEQGTEQLFKA
jgi:hypothetical protein